MLSERNRLLWLEQAGYLPACPAMSVAGGPALQVPARSTASHLSHDRASAAVLCTPAMCRARMTIRKCAVKKCKHRSICMRGSRADPDDYGHVVQERLLGPSP